MKTYALKCPGCGAGLKVGDSVNSFACTYCGASVGVERAGGIVSLQLVDAIAGVQRGTDRTAAELALVRLPSEIQSVHFQMRVAEGRSSFLRQRLAEAETPINDQSSSMQTAHTIQTFVIGAGVFAAVSFVLNLTPIPLVYSVGVGAILAVLSIRAEMTREDYKDKLKEEVQRVGALRKNHESAPGYRNELTQLVQNKQSLQSRLEQLQGQLDAARRTVDS